MPQTATLHCAKCLELISLFSFYFVFPYNDYGVRHKLGVRTLFVFLHFRSLIMLMFLYIIRDEEIHLAHLSNNV